MQKIYIEWLLCARQRGYSCTGGAVVSKTVMGFLCNVTKGQHQPRFRN